MKYILCSLLLFFSLNIFAQNKYKTEKDVSAKVLSNYDEAFRQASSNQFEAAEKNLRKALDKEPTFLDAKILLANVLYERENYAEAEREFEEVLRINPAYNYRVYYNLGITERRLEKYDEAVVHLRDFINTDPDERMRGKAQEYMRSSEFMAKAVANPVPFSPENLGAGVNTELSEYLPSFTADGETLIFTRLDRDEDFFTATKDANGAWQTGEPLTDINTDDNEGAQTVTADGKFLVFTACNRKDNIGSCDLYFSELKNGKYTEPQLLPEGINTRQWESQPSLTPNGDALYFTSTRPGGVGKSDIFVSYRINGKWTNPRNLGRTVNTAGDDQTPFIHADGQTLYFSSDGHPGVGERDLFFTRWNVEKRDWDEPTNMGIPINTDKTEGTLVVSLDGKTAYFASDRKDFAEARGRVDLYQFELYEAARPSKVTYVKAIVTDAVTGAPLEAEVEITNLTKNLPYLTAATDTDGTFLVVMGVGKDYGLSVNKTGYLFYSDNFALEKVSEVNEPFVLEIKLTPLPDSTSAEIAPSARPVVLKNIFFESGKAELLENSVTELNRLKALLEDNARLKIQINGHTDNVGGDEANLTLSTDRARAVYDWLVEQGLAAERLKYKGYGENQPIADNDTEAGRRTNRRTEFVLW